MLKVLVDDFLLQIKATYVKPIHTTIIWIVVNCRYTLIPLPLGYFGKCLNLGCHTEVMPYGVYTHTHVYVCVCCVQDVLDIILKDADTHQLCLDNIEKWGCVLGKGMNNQMFDVITYSSNYCKLDCKVLLDGYDVSLEDGC